MIKKSFFIAGFLHIVDEIEIHEAFSEATGGEPLLFFDTSDTNRSIAFLSDIGLLMLEKKFYSI